MHVNKFINYYKIEMRNNTNLGISLMILTTFLFSCMDGVSKFLADNKIKISADIVLNNPNKAKITVTYIDLDIVADGIPLVNINDNLNKELTGENKSTLNIIGDINVKNLEKFLNQNGIAILLGSDKTQLKFIGEIEAKAYGFKEKINIDFSLNNFKDIIR